jgi:hypothetical protein
LFVIPAQAGIQLLSHPLRSKDETKKNTLNKTAGFRPAPDNQRLARLRA